MVYVLDIEGKPLMPTERHGKVRRLLREGMAHVVRLQPFTIQLDYESTTYKQEVSLGIDAGSVHIGVSATTVNKELFSAEVILRKDIVYKMSSRAELRKKRRGKKTRFRAMRFGNRKKKNILGTPSVKNRIDTHIKVCRFLHSILPIKRIIIEVASFDTQKIKNDKIQSIEYQKGEQLGFWNVREYVLARDGHKCQYCKGKSGDKILNVHHLESRKVGGNAPNNLITLCATCHKALHKGEIELSKKRGLSLRNEASMNIIKWGIFEIAQKLFNNVKLTYGYITKYNRIMGNIEKSHNADAFCISGNLSATRLNHYLKMKCIPRHTRMLHVSNPQKRGIRRSRVASHWIGNTNLQRYDTVKWKGVICFIAGSTNGRPIIRDIDGKQIALTPSVNYRTLKFIKRNKGFLIQEYKNL